jgi:hypothetical protein
MMNNQNTHTHIIIISIVRLSLVCVGGKGAEERNG